MSTDNSHMLRHETITVHGKVIGRRFLPGIYPGKVVMVENIANRWYAEITHVTRVGRELHALLVEVKPVYLDDFTIRDIDGNVIEIRDGLTLKVTDEGLPYGIDSDYAYSIEVAQ